MNSPVDMTPEVSAPLSLVAEVTHRCPLHCVYCSNPVGLKAQKSELTTEEWLRVFEEAHALGVVQLHFSGGEPLERADLEQFVRRARELGFYTNLITSGVGLDRGRSRALAAAGLDSLQLSLQASRADLSNTIAGMKAFKVKKQVAEITRPPQLPLSMNVVLHRYNLDDLEEIVDLCASWGAERLELANAQYYGWALLNLDKLLPTREQIVTAEKVYRRKKELLKGKMELIWVRPDYYEPFPKPCMGGWGQMHMTISPDGTVLPCPVASTIETLHFESIRQRPLGWIWRESPAFNRFRGFAWMPEPCRSCDRRFRDFGGCRCQAFALTGDASNTDPVCQWAPRRALIEAAVAKANQQTARAGNLAPAVKDNFRRFTYRHLRTG